MADLHARRVIPADFNAMKLHQDATLQEFHALKVSRLEHIEKKVDEMPAKVASVLSQQRGPA
jgi:ferric iron reductase protein FhuF